MFTIANLCGIIHKKQGNPTRHAHTHPWRNWIAHQIPILTVGGSNPFGCAIKVFTITAKTFFYFQTDSYLSLTRLMPCIAIAITLVPRYKPACLRTSAIKISSRQKDGSFALLIVFNLPGLSKAQGLRRRREPDRCFLWRHSDVCPERR